MSLPTQHPQALLLRLRTIHTSARNAMRLPGAQIVYRELDLAVEALARALSIMERQQSESCNGSRETVVQRS